MTWQSDHRLIYQNPFTAAGFLRSAARRYAGQLGVFNVTLRDAANNSRGTSLDQNVIATNPRVTTPFFFALEVTAPNASLQ